LAAAAAVIVVEHPPVHDRVAQLHSACGQCVFVDVLALAVDPPELTGLAAVVGDRRTQAPASGDEA
jgi:hypothetical protein